MPVQAMITRELEAEKQELEATFVAQGRQGWGEYVSR